MALAGRRRRFDCGDGRLVELVRRNHARAAILGPDTPPCTPATDAARSAGRNRPKPRCHQPERNRWFRPASAPLWLRRLAAEQRRFPPAASAWPAIERRRTRPAGRRPGRGRSTMTGWFRTVSRRNANRFTEGISASTLSSSPRLKVCSGMQRGHASGVPVERADRCSGKSGSAEIAFRRETSRRAARPRSPAPSCRTCWDAASAGSR